VHVYTTEAKGITPRGVWDAPITGERWLIPPMTLRQVRVIDRATVLSVTTRTLQYHRITGQPSNVRLKLCLFARALEVFPGSALENRIVERGLATFGITNPAQYIVDRIAETSEFAELERELTTAGNSRRIDEVHAA
jgi:hypothetical protein